jgi:hypothetical protein
MMLGMNRSLALAVLATLLVAAPAGARTPSRTDRVAAANAFAQRTLSFARQQRAAFGRANKALAARHVAAQACLAVWQSAPLGRIDDLRVIYFAYLSGALWSVDAAIFESWIGGLRRSKVIQRSPALAGAVDWLRVSQAEADVVYRAFPDACATVTRWRDGGWTDAAREQVLAPLHQRPAPLMLALQGKELPRAQRELRRYARSGKAAAKILRVGTDEPDARVHFHTACDELAVLLFPLEYRVC